MSPCCGRVATVSRPRGTFLWSSDKSNFFVAPAPQRHYKPPSKANMQKISVIVPCLNEEIVLPGFYERMTAAAAGWGVDYEILCVDDGSRDRTWELLKAQNQKDPRWRCLSFARNFGHQTAVSAGLYHSTGDAAVVIDADLQDSPEEIARLLAKWGD